MDGKCWHGLFTRTAHLYLLFPRSVREVALGCKPTSRLLFILFPRPRQGVAHVWIQHRGLDSNQLVCEIHVVGPSLYEFYSVVRFPDGLEDVAEFESADRGVVEEGSKDKVGSRGDDDDAVFCFIEFPGEDISL